LSEIEMLKIQRMMPSGIWTLLGATMMAALGSDSGMAQEKPRDIVAATIRSQGHPCDQPKRLLADEEASSPDEPAWVLECSNAKYWVKYEVVGVVWTAFAVS